MRKKFKIFTAAFLASVISLTGCSLPKDNTQPATEYVTEDSSAEASDDSAAAASSGGDNIIIVDDLFEPLLEEIESALEGASEEASAAASSSAEPEVKEVDRLEMVFIGDSQMANGRSDGTDLASLVSARVPNSVAYNLGIGGTTASLEESTSELSPEKWTSNCFLGIAYALTGKADRNQVLSNNPEVLATMEKIDPAKVDYYFIEYGANDFFNKVPLDNTDSDVPYVKTFYGALNTGIDEIRTVSPNAKIVLMTPFYGIYKDGNGNYIGDTYVVSNGIDTLANYARKIGNVVEAENVFDFDCMFISKCDLYLDTYEEYLMDGTHLSLKGRQVFARLLAHIPNWYEGFEPFAYMENDIVKIAEFDPNEYYRYPDDLMQEYYPQDYERMQNGEYLLAPPQ